MHGITFSPENIDSNSRSRLVSSREEVEEEIFPPLDASWLIAKLRMMTLNLVRIPAHFAFLASRHNVVLSPSSRQPASRYEGTKGERKKIPQHRRSYRQNEATLTPQCMELLFHQKILTVTFSKLYALFPCGLIAGPSCVARCLPNCCSKNGHECGGPQPTTGGALLRPVLRCGRGLRLYTWNVVSLERRLPALLLVAHCADVFLLTETRSPSDRTLGTQVRPA